jgi:hypothetical protein
MASTFEPESDDEWYAAAIALSGRCRRRCRQRSRSRTTKSHRRHRVVPPTMPVESMMALREEVLGRVGADWVP